MDKKLVKRYIAGALAIAITAVFQAFATKANIGVAGCWEAISLQTYDLFGLKVGYFSMAANFSVILLQLAVLRKDFKPVKFLLAVVAIGFGMIVNVVLYDCLDFEITSYWIKLLFCAGGYFGMAVFLGVATLVGTIQMPVENTSYAIHQKYGWNFAAIRMFPDAFCMVVSIIMTLLLGLSFKVREGTVLSVLILGPVMKWSMGWQKPLLEKWGLCKNE